MSPFHGQKVTVGCSYMGKSDGSSSAVLSTGHHTYGFDPECLEDFVVHQESGQAPVCTELGEFVRNHEIRRGN